MAWVLSVYAIWDSGILMWVVVLCLKTRELCIVCLLRIAMGISRLGACNFATLSLNVDLEPILMLLFLQTGR